jgi:hypothetical protein
MMSPIIWWTLTPKEINDRRSRNLNQPHDLASLFAVGMPMPMMNIIKPNGDVPFSYHAVLPTDAVA